VAVPNNIAVAWPSTAASIPANWTRETSLDTKHIRGAAAGADSDLVSALGATTVTHTEPGSHTPIQNSHVHDVSSSTGIGSTAYNSGVATNTLAADTHSHSSLDSDPTTGTNQSKTITISAANNDPPFRKVIWIKSNGVPTGIPNGAYAFFDSDSLPGSWTRAEADNFLKGADAAGDGTGTGGTLNCTPTESGTHTHIQDAHTHTGTSSASAASVLGGGTGLAAGDGHHHPYTLDSATAVNNASSVSFGATNHEPTFKKLNIILNGTGANSLPTGVIALYLGTNGSIPTDWSRFTTMDDQFLKGCNANGQVGNTGGSASHTHTATCSTTSNAHTHTLTAGGADIALGKGVGTAGAATLGHTHTWTIVSSTITHQNASLTISTDAAFPLYQKIIFVKFTPGGVVTSQLAFMGAG